MQDEAANFPDPNARASQESDFTLELRARDRERKLIKKIDEALARLDAGEYGECESCGVEIGIRRLEARPTATLCIECKTLDEIREKQKDEKHRRRRAFAALRGHSKHPLLSGCLFFRGLECAS